MKNTIALLFALALGTGFVHAQEKKPEAKKSAKPKPAAEKKERSGAQKADDTLEWAHKNKIWMHKK
ncbi:MAG TPA: hypothetical protein VM183_19930 [Burkholderiales bacterium]|nr:hypothetical protein [Burkholderiales bacterium]